MQDISCFLWDIPREHDGFAAFDSGRRCVSSRESFPAERKGKWMGVYEELIARGLLAQLTDEDRIRDMINNGRATFYIGFDPTADSLHVGHFMALAR